MLHYDSSDVPDGTRPVTPLDTSPATQEETQFWEDLDNSVCCLATTHERIDDALRAWLELVSSSLDHYLLSEDDIALCSQKLLDSPIFAANCAYVRTQIIYSLLQEDEARPLHAIANFLLLDGRSDDAVFRSMIDAGCFARLVDLINGRRDDDRQLHRLLLQLMYEMARMERVRVADLLHVDDGFIIYLFRIIEDPSDDADDPYHYPVIRVLYMVAATTAVVEPMSPAAPLTNRVIKILSLNGPLYRTFGENIILLLNRETETSLQLLILKLLYLLFTTTATYEYFYTNDLRVLLDVVVRNLLDLPDESISLRHTYLRVFYPLLAHTQLNQAPHYKRGEILRVLSILRGSGNTHFAPADDTTLRLVDRVSKVEWLAETPPSSVPASPSSPTGTTDTTGTAATSGTSGTSGTAMTNDTTASTVESSASSTTDASEDTVAQEAESRVVNKMLGISLSHVDSGSWRSVVDVAAVTEKPGVKTPSRRAVFACRNKMLSASDTNGLVDTGGCHGIAALEGASQSEPCLVKQTIFEQPTQGAPAAARAALREYEDDVAAARPVAAPKQPRLRPKRVLPAVPKHRHGVLVKQPPPADAGVTDSGGAGTAPAAAAAAGGIKKLPPKAPPPRRMGRLKQVASNAKLQASAQADVTSGVTAVEPSTVL